MTSKKQFLKDGLGWGFVLWLLGYVLGIIFFSLVPGRLIGWFVTPLGIAAAILVLRYRVRGTTMQYYIAVAAAWLLIAVVCDFLFLVLAFHAHGYYKLPDVYFYYALTFVLPLAVGRYKLRRNK